MKGATASLDIIAEKLAEREKSAEESKDKDNLRRDFAEFSKKLPALSPEEASQGWLLLVDKFVAAIGEDSVGSHNGPTIDPMELIDVLPPPTAWPQLARAINERPAANGDSELREIGLRLFSATLTGNIQARNQAITGLQERVSKAGSESYSLLYSIQNINDAILSLTDDPALILKSLERKLASASEMERFEVPDLVPLVGADKAKSFLEQALQKPVKLSFQGKAATANLARQMALEMVDKLKVPQWELAQTIEATDLYEALTKRFATTNSPTADSSEPDHTNLVNLTDSLAMTRRTEESEARLFYMFGLIRTGRTVEAIAVAQTTGLASQTYSITTIIGAMEKAGFTTELDAFFYELLKKDPLLPFWKNYIPLAANAGQAARMLDLARSTAARSDLSVTKKAEIQSTLADALLASDQVDEAAQQLRELVNSTTNNSKPHLAEGARAFNAAVNLWSLGTLLKNAAWKNEGISAARALWKSHPSQPDDFEMVSPHMATRLAGLLIQNGEHAEAESIITEAIVQFLKNVSTDRNFYGFGAYSHPDHLLIYLATVYHRAGRNQEVIALLEQAPYWSGTELAEVGLDYDRSSMQINPREREQDLPLLYLAASALTSVGRTNEALAIVNTLLDREPGLDAGYELLLRINGEKAMVQLNELFAQDRFQERPLIWKAQLLLNQKKLDEAEKVIRQAISIDPSDGEQGPGDRMRAYAILADLLEAQGKDASVYRGAVKAIRLSEEADKFYAAGLLKRAIEMYRESLTYFADAYCIQSRLAIQLAEQGRHEEAEAHYRRAYELMPESFGRIESHCFGCERAFDGDRAQGLAEKVFIDLSKKMAEKPQVHYLLGYLREEQNRHAEALAHYRRATKLDPDYLNAWKRMHEMTEVLRIPAQERDEIAFNLLRLDPLQQHASVNFQKISDLATVWALIEAAYLKQPTKGTNLLTLTASKKASERRDATPNAALQNRNRQNRLNWAELEKRSPGRVIAQNPFISAAFTLFCSTQAW